MKYFQKEIKELKQMEKDKIIAKVDEPTDWVNRMLTSSKKNGDIRNCIDPQALSKALERELLMMYYQICQGQEYFQSLI